MEKAPPPLTSAEMAKKRWAGTSAKTKAAHIAKMNAARAKKQRPND